MRVFLSHNRPATAAGMLVLCALFTGHATESGASEMAANSYDLSMASAASQVSFTVRAEMSCAGEPIVLVTQQATDRSATVAFFISGFGSATANSSDFDAIANKPTAVLAAVQRKSGGDYGGTAAIGATSLVTLMAATGLRIGEVNAALGRSCANEIGLVLNAQGDIDARLSRDPARGLVAALRVLVTLSGLPYANVIARTSYVVAPSGDRGLIM